MATLVYHAGALGDFVSILPSLVYYRSVNKKEELTLLSKKQHGLLAADLLLVDRWYDVTGRSFSELFSDVTSPALRELLSAFTSAIVFTDNSSPVLKHLRSSGVRDIQYHAPFPSCSIPAALYHMSLFTKYESPLPVIKPSRKSTEHPVVKAVSPASVVIHPGSGSPLKNWPFDRFRETADTLRRYGLRILWATGETETELNLQFPPGDTVLRCADLPVLARVLSKCALYIGNDSGVTHLAAAVGCPTIALFGSSDPAVWAPCYAHVIVISHSVPCGPCHRSGRKCRDSVRCMNLIETGEVFRAALELTRCQKVER